MPDPIFDPSKPFEAAPVAPAAAAVPTFDPSKPFTPAPAPEATPTFDLNKSFTRQYTFDDVKRSDVKTLAEDKDFAPVRFSVEHEQELQQDPEALNRVIEAYRLKETKGSTLLEKGKKVATGFIPAVKHIAGGLYGAQKTLRGVSEGAIPRLGKAYLKGGDAPADEAVKLASEVAAIPASLESNVANYVDLGGNVIRSIGETAKGVARAATGGGTVKEAVSTLGKSELTPEEFRARYFSDVGAAKTSQEAAMGQGPAMKALALDADSLKTVGVEVDPQKISELSVVTDPLNFVPVGAAVGVVSKGTRALGKNIIARTLNEAQAASLAKIMNDASAAARGVSGAGLQSGGRALEAVGRGTQTTVKRIGGVFGGTGLGALLGFDPVRALGVGVAVKALPKAIELAGRGTKAAGEMISGVRPVPAPLGLAGEALKQGAIGTAEGAAIAAPFVVGARTEDEENILGMIPIAGLARAGTVAPKAARVTGRYAQDRLAQDIFKAVEQQAPEATVPYYGTDATLDAAHAAAVESLEPQEKNFLNLLRNKFERSGVEIYTVDPDMMQKISGRDTTSGFAVEAVQRTNPDGTSSPIFRVYLNKDASALPHEAYHALEFLDPSKATEFEQSVAASLTPEQKNSFAQIYNSALNGGKPEAAWTSRLSDAAVNREVAAEAFSRVILGQDLSGVTPTVRKQAALFASGLLEKLGAPLATLGAEPSVGGSDLGGVRAGTGSVKLAQDWVTGLLNKVEKEGGLLAPEVAGAPKTTIKEPPAAPSPVAEPAPATPPAPTPPAVTAPNIRVERGAQDKFSKRASDIGKDKAIAAAEKLGPEITSRVQEVTNFIESGAPVLEIEHQGVISASTPDAPLGRTNRRAEQEAAYVAEQLGAVPEEVRTAYQKTFVPVRWEVVGGKPQLLAMSLDKVLANISRSVKDAVSAGAEKLIPYEIADGKLTEAAWNEVVKDLQSYSENQANGFRGDGQSLTRPTGDAGLSIPAETPGFSPTILPENKANFQNLIQGLNPPLTARETKGQIPGNVKGQILAEVNKRAPETPTVIRPEDIKKQEFKSVPGRSIKETNPLRNQLAEAGVPVRELIEVTERVNAQDITKVAPRPDLNFRAPVTDIIRGGFKPEKGKRVSDLLDKGLLANKPPHGPDDHIASYSWISPEGDIFNGPTRGFGHESWALQNIVGGSGSEIANAVLSLIPGGNQFVGTQLAKKKGWLPVYANGHTASELGIYVEGTPNARQLEVLEDQAFSQQLPVFAGRGRRDKILISSTEKFLERRNGGSFKPSQGESVAEYGKRVLEMSKADFDQMVADKSLTGLAYDLGLELKDKTDLPILQTLAEGAGEMFKTKLAEGDIDTAMDFALRKQFFNEIFQAATNTGGAVKGLQRLRPGQTSPFPEGRAEPEPLTASEKDYQAELDFVQTGKRLTEFPFYESYEKTIKDEAAIIPDDVEDILFIGSGPVPISPILFAKEGYNVRGMDYSNEAVRFGKIMAEREGSPVTLEEGDATTTNPGNADLIFVALEAGKTPEARRKIFENVHQQAPEALVMVRASNDRNFPQLPEGLESLYDIENQTPSFDGLSETYLLRPKDSGAAKPKTKKAERAAAEEEEKWLRYVSKPEGYFTDLAEKIISNPRPGEGSDLVRTGGPEALRKAAKLFENMDRAGLEKNDVVDVKRLIESRVNQEDNPTQYYSIREEEELPLPGEVAMRLRESSSPMGLFPEWDRPKNQPEQNPFSLVGTGFESHRELAEFAMNPEFSSEHTPSSLNIAPPKFVNVAKLSPEHRKILSDDIDARKRMVLEVADAMDAVNPPKFSATSETALPELDFTGPPQERALGQLADEWYRRGWFTSRIRALDTVRMRAQSLLSAKNEARWSSGFYKKPTAKEETLSKVKGFFSGLTKPFNDAVAEFRKNRAEVPEPFLTQKALETVRWSEAARRLIEENPKLARELGGQYRIEDVAEQLLLTPDKPLNSRPKDFQAIASELFKYGREQLQDRGENPGAAKPATKAGQAAEDAGYEVRRVADPAQPGIVISKDGAPVGVLETVREAPDRVNVAMIRVNKSERGKGLSEVMYRELGKLLQEQGVTEVTGMIVNPNAIKARSKVFPETVITNDIGDTLTPEEAVSALQADEIGIEAESFILEDSSFKPKAKTKAKVTVKRDDQGRPLTKDGLVDYEKYYAELSATRAAEDEAALASIDVKKYAPPSAPKSSTKSLTGWVLPDGKFTTLGDSAFHEDYLAKRSKELNERFGTKFSKNPDVEERLMALNKGFIRMRQDANGSSHIELNRRYWTPTIRRGIEGRLLDNADTLNSVFVTLLDNEGNPVDSVHLKLHDLPDDQTPEAAITEGIRSLRGGSAKPRPSENSPVLPGFKEEVRGVQGALQRKVAAAKQNFPEAIPPTYQKVEGKVAIGDDGKPKVVAIEYNLIDTPAAKEAAKGIRDETERRDAVATELAKRLEKTYKKAVSNPDIKAGEKWYSTARTRLKKVFGDDSKLFAELLGATSARTSVDINYGFALEAYNQLKAGAYDELLTKYRAGKEQWEKRDLNEFIEETGNENPTRRQFLDWYVEKHKLLPLQSNGKKFGMNSRAVLKVLDGSWREEVTGPKTPNFTDNLTGDSFEATIDIWAARLLHRLANEGNEKRWRILPENETGVKDSDFELGQAAFRKAAEKLGVKPDSLQALLWFAEKDHWEKKGWTGAVGSKKSDFNTFLAETEDTPSGKKKLRELQENLFDE